MSKRPAGAARTPPHPETRRLGRRPVADGFSREETFEDDTITDPAERTRIFGQYDHRRIYGRDYADRLRSAGFEVADIDFAASLTEAERRLYAPAPTTIFYVVLQSPGIKPHSYHKASGR